MKSSLTVLTLAAAGFLCAAASPTLKVRQNDVPKCADGRGDGLRSYDSRSKCEDGCKSLKEEAEGDNKGGICSGFCTTYPGPQSFGIIIRCNDAGGRLLLMRIGTQQVVKS
ncbi:uncharacterized protein MYCGRDRAFT_92826 [Zymoseptoria tritici IPO323]|uniref:Secreted protein n=1 Tax=Zymoseptoria tritici (strain CBS 115943 / IPO323) TaxID=336722 RepID=F9X8K0_ZYMTI|nr:uncharacterized protein MYCGRDRAFT_92826 [Zymoseptoria tritici IPO323]EGP88105.1 hypothetical protein MYCGRDRAFT_92826 [Zymoseptoria tritici IPO323]